MEYLVLNLRQYPIWQTRLNGAPLPPIPHKRHDGLATLLLPAGTDTIDVVYHRTPDQTAGLTLSALAFLIALFVRAKEAEGFPHDHLRTKSEGDPGHFSLPSSAILFAVNQP